MSLNHLVIYTVGIFLIQNIIYNFSTTYNVRVNNRHYNYKQRFFYSQILLITFSIVINKIYTYLIFFNLEYLFILIFSIVGLLIFKIFNLIYEKASVVLNLNNDNYTEIVLITTLQMAFCSIFTINEPNLAVLLIYNVSVSILYLIIAHTIIHIMSQIKNSEIPKSLKGAPIGFLTSAIITFTLLGIL